MADHGQECKRAALWVSQVAPAFLPEGYFPLDEPYGEFPSDPAEKCDIKPNRMRFPRSINLDISIIDTSYMHSLVAIPGIESRSLAPWHYRLDVDPDRYPFVIAEATCLGSVCMDSNGKKNPGLVSLPIQQEVLVLRREQRDCRYVYRLETQRVTLGCTCARPLTLP
uniref:Interleukin-17F n=1 Tax=Xenopus tropicalis TaxID=8364 RepID=A0A803JD60_XENTR